MSRGVNQWNHYYVRALGHHIQAWLNGVKTFDTIDEKGALSGKIGSNERRSATIGIPFLYVAAPLSGGAVRMAYTADDVQRILAQLAPRFKKGIVAVEETVAVA